ncbi:MAG: methyltransferase, partial [Erysipelotrichaceae bacterium]|nr:methyltransferase [Erysipelotrichaceae bacterium]
MSEETWLDALEKQARGAHVPVMLEDGLVFLTGYIAAHPEICSILEAGTAVGVSSMRMAGVRDDITVDTLEIDEGMYAQAVENIRNAGFSDRIHVHLCDAVEFETDKQYDLIFIDAAKSQYRSHLEH